MSESKTQKQATETAVQTQAAEPAKKETLVQRLVRCTNASKRRAQTFLSKATDGEKSKLENAKDPELAHVLHELATIRYVKNSKEKEGAN